MAFFTALAAIGSAISQASAASKQRKQAASEAKLAEDKMIAAGSMERTAADTGAAVELGTETVTTDTTKKKARRVLPTVSASSMVGGL